MIKVTLLSCAIAFFGLIHSSIAEAKSKPNVIILLADDMTWFDCEPYGSPNVKTPNMRRLADEGMRFDAMFTATAMCAPTRQQLYTGLFPIRSGAFPNHSKVKAGTKSITHHLSKLGYQVSLEGKTHFGPKESFPFKKISLSNILKSKSSPFCHIVASSDPHKPWSTGDATQFDPNKLIVPPNLIDTPHTREVLCSYYAEITHLDDKLGSIMKALEEAGIAQNTILIFTSEQGMTLPLGGKFMCYDTGLKTAFLVRWPGTVKPGSVTQALAQYVDVVPTLVDIAGGNPKEINTGRKDASGEKGFDGRSFLAVLKGEANTFRDYVYGVQTNKGIKNGGIYPVRSARDTRYKYIRNLNHTERFTNAYTKDGKYYGTFFEPLIEAAETSPAIKTRLTHFQQRPSEELYDLKSDPYELKNLAEDPSLAQVKAELAKALDAWMKQQGDQGIKTEANAKTKKR